jgi:hypothetical protein
MKIFDWLLDGVKAVGRGIKKAAVAVGKAALWCISAKKSADVVVVFASKAGYGSGNTAVEARHLTAKIVPEKVLIKTGKVVQFGAKKVEIAATKLHCWKLATACAKVGAHAALYVGTAVASVGICLAIFGAAYLLKRLAKKFWAVPQNVADAVKTFTVLHDCITPA